MSAVTGSATPLSAAEVARRKAYLPKPTTPTPSIPTTSAATQATEGAQAAQPEAYNAPPLDLPRDPSTRDVLVGIARVAGDPTVNETTAQRLLQVHEMLLAAEKQMIQSVLDGIVG